jgi:hypothetical protein
LVRPALFRRAQNVINIAQLLGMTESGHNPAQRDGKLGVIR